MDQMSSNGMSPIHVAAKNGSIKVLKLFFEYAERMSCKEKVIENRDSERNAPLHLAVHGGEIKVSDLMCQAAFYDPETRWKDRTVRSRTKSLRIDFDGLTQVTSLSLIPVRNVYIFMPLKSLDYQRKITHETFTNNSKIKMVRLSLLFLST